MLGESSSYIQLQVLQNIYILYLFFFIKKGFNFNQMVSLLSCIVNSIPFKLTFKTQKFIVNNPIMLFRYVFYSLKFIRKY